MATLHEYFDTGFARWGNLATTLTLSSDGLPNLEVTGRLHFDFESNAEFIFFYISQNPSPSVVIASLLNQLNLIFEIKKAVLVTSGFPDERAMDLSELKFTGRIYFYNESGIPQIDIDSLVEAGPCKGSVSFFSR